VNVRSERVRIIKAIAPLSVAFGVAAIALAVPASADSDCQFGGGSACASGPQDDYADIYGPYSPGYSYGGGFGYGGPGLWVGGLIPDNAAPGVSAGVGTGRVTGPS
jgi:hypothetical protein